MKEGWEIKKLGKVCDLIGGGTPSKKNSKFYDGDILWATVRDMKSEIISDTEFKITEEAVKKSSTNIIPKGNVIIATRVGLGKVCLIDKDTAINQDLRGVVPKKSKQLNNRFIFQWFKSISHIIVKEGTGATVQGVKLPFVKDLPIPIPPLPEQERIVSILDECFAAIDQAKANAEQNLKNAKELFESYLQGVFEIKGDGWKEKKLLDLVDEDCKLSYGIVQPGQDYSDGLPVVRPTDLTTRYIKIKGLKLIDPKLAEGYTRTKLIGDELLLCVRGSTGVLSIATEELKGANVTRGIVPIRFDSTIIDQNFGYYLMISNYVQNQIRAKTYGAALMQINIGDLRKIETPYPKLEKQQTIVRQLDAMRTETQKLEAVYQKKLDDLEELKKSILQKAFAGNLPDRQAGLMQAKNYDLHDESLSLAAEPTITKSRRDAKIIENKINQTKPNPEGVK